MMGNIAMPLDAAAVLIAVRDNGGLAREATQAHLTLDAAAPVGNYQPRACVVNPIKS